MLPASFTIIEAIPLTVNGKLDVRALPEPELTTGLIYVAPRNELEGKLCAIWEDVLGIKKVGIYDNFFQIGGTSINAIRIIGKCKEEEGIRVTLLDLFEYGTVAGISKNIQSLAIDVQSQIITI